MTGRCIFSGVTAREVDDVVKVDKVDEHLHRSVGGTRCISVGYRTRYVADFGFLGSYQTCYK